MKLDPNSNGHKYLNLAEFLKGKNSLQAYKKGIELMTAQRQALLSVGNNTEADVLTKQIATAYASIAELYMTDLWYISIIVSDEENAEETCESSLKAGLSIDPTNADALKCLANLRILRERDPEASELLDKLLVQILDESIILKSFIDEGRVFNDDFCKETARLLMELSRFADCVKILEKVVSVSDENVEAWYLLAFANYSNGKYEAAKDGVNILHELFKKSELKDKEIEEATAELDEKLKEFKGKGTEMEEEDDEKDEDDDDEKKSENMEDDEDEGMNDK